MLDIRALALLAVAIASAGCEDRERTEAQLFLDRMDTVDPAAPLRERETRVRSVKQLSLASGPIRAARDLCMDAHEALLKVETAQAEMHLALAAVEGREAQLSATDRDKMEAALATAQSELERANTLLPRCQEHVDALSARFRKRR